MVFRGFRVLELFKTLNPDKPVPPVLACWQCCAQAAMFTGATAVAAGPSHLYAPALKL
jgi:hypothetical protein